MSADLLCHLPSVNELLTHAQELVAAEGHQRVVDALRDALSSAREAVRTGQGLPTQEAIISLARESLQPIGGTGSTVAINATGVIIHTNLGRAVLSKAAQQAIDSVAGAFSPLEFDLRTGQRGQRGVRVERLLCEVTGAEDALVVNNCAAATVLLLSAVASGRAVIISRGQLVEIGGGFRIPDIMVQSGSRLIEVGTTNRTRLTDYEMALRSNTDVAALLRVHPSNFRMLGFTQSVAVEELVGLVKSIQAPLHVLDDLGSGALLDTQVFGLSHEPMPQESIRAGVAVVTFSGDKLLGGPQAGILAGKHEVIEQCRRHPLARAFRADKFTLAALGATVLHYLRGEAVREVPVWRMIALTREKVRERAACCLQALDPWLHGHAITAELLDGESTVGGGSLPGDTLPTCLIVLKTEQPEDLAATLRAARMPIITRIQDGCVQLDLRTVLDDQALMTSINTIG